jgi:hypothetical protein
LELSQLKTDLCGFSRLLDIEYRRKVRDSFYRFERIVSSGLKVCVNLSFEWEFLIRAALLDRV